MILMASSKCEKISGKFIIISLNMEKRIYEASPEGKLPPFIRKLLEILEDERNKSTIRFDRVRNRLEIVSKKKLERLLPKYFRHRNFDSFSRQLNWYGFIKMRGEKVHIYTHSELQMGGRLQDIKSKRILPPLQDVDEGEAISHSGRIGQNDAPIIYQPQVEGCHNTMGELPMFSFPQLTFQPALVLAPYPMEFQPFFSPQASFCYPCL